MLMMLSYTKIFSSLRQLSKSISTSSMLAITHLLPLAPFLLLPCQCLPDLHMILLCASKNNHNLFNAKSRNSSTFLPRIFSHVIQSDGGIPRLSEVRSGPGPGHFFRTWTWPSMTGPVISRTWTWTSLDRVH